MVTYDKKAAIQIERSYQAPEIIRQRIQTLDALALRAGEKVLDAGCGTGFLVQEMAKIVGATGKVSGLDYSADMLEFARDRCDQTPNIELQQGSVTALDFTSDSFDAVSCTQTLLYVKEVDTAISELHRVLKPHGRIAILETDWRGTVLNSINHKITRAILDGWDHSVASPNLPPKIIPLLLAQGFSAIKVEAIPLLNTSYSEQNFSSGMLAFFANYAIDAGLISEQESKQWLAEIKQLAEHDAYFFCVNRFLFTAVK